MKKILPLLLALAAPIVMMAQDSKTMLALCDSLAMQTPVIRRMTMADKAKYSVRKLDYGMTIGIERTPKGRIWNCFVGGGDNADAFFLLNWSDNDGKKWSDVKFIIDPHDANLPFKRRTIVGQLWTDPHGRLWLFMDQAMTYFDGRSGNWCAVCENPDDPEPVWSEPKYIGFGCTLNKPIVTSGGEWVLPVSLWVRNKLNVCMERGWVSNPLCEAHHELDSIRGAHTFVSTDEGQTWEDRGFVLMPKPSFDEQNYIELKDGRLWMTARTGIGICECFSSDGGRTWTEPVLYQPHVNSRHFILRLQSGRLLLVRHGNPQIQTKKRSHLSAYLSDDEGKTWQGGLMLDEREGVSYPTGFQTSDGVIYISYDYERTREGELYLNRFTEADILARKIITRKCYVRKLFYKPGCVKYSKANLTRDR